VVGRVDVVEEVRNKDAADNADIVVVWDVGSAVEELVIVVVVRESLKRMRSGGWEDCLQE